MLPEKQVWSLTAAGSRCASAMGKGSTSLPVLIVQLRCSRDVLTLPHHGSTEAPKSCVGLEKTLKAKEKNSWGLRTELQ